MRMRRMGGFTLVELLVVIGIIAILAGLASLGMDIVRKERVSSVTKELFADLQRVRVNAMTQDSPAFGIRFESANSYTIFKFNDCNNDYSYDPNTCNGNSREETNVVNRSVPASVVLKKNNPNTDFNNGIKDILMFDRFGIPRHDNWSLGMMTIVVKDDRDGGSTKCVSVSTNRIREGVWEWDRHERRYTCIET